MTSPARRTITRRLPLGLIGMLILIGLIEGLVDRMSLSVLSQEELDWTAMHQLAGGRTAKCDILCFGDSMVKFGIAPRVLENRLHRTVYNLAVLDGKPAFTYYLFRRALEAGARPSAVLVDFQPEMLFEDVRNQIVNPNWKFSRLDLLESLDVAWHYRDPSFFGRLVLARAFPSIRGRGRVRGAIQSALAGALRSRRETNLTIRRNQWVNHGGILLARNPKYGGTVQEDWQSIMYAMPWKCQPAHAEYIQRFLKLAESRKIAVYWLLPPNTPAVLSQRFQIGLFASYDAFIGRALGRFANLVVLDPRRSGYRHDQFVDPVHLDCHGAQALTFDVAEAMDRRLPGDPSAERWVALPALHEPPVALSLEDVARSRAIVKLDEARRRR